MLAFVDLDVDHFGSDTGFDMGLRTRQFGSSFDGMNVEDDQRTARLDDTYLAVQMPSAPCSISPR